MKRLSLFLMATLALGACQTTPHQEEVKYVDTATSSKSYSDVLDKWTRRERAYNGVTATFEVTTTLLAEEVLEHQVRLDTEQFRWTNEQYREARQKVLYEGQTNTTMFVSLFTEKDENNNLDKDKKDWNIFLDASGKRVTPSSVKRLYDNKLALQTKYPYYNIWSRAYLIKFPISTAMATQGRAVLTIAGPLGAASLAFPKDD